jgi:diguanylate cyclase (GGDEF)-like protein
MAAGHNTLPAWGQGTREALLLRDLAAVLRDRRGRDETLAAVLALLHEHLSTAVALVWSRDPAGQWRLLDTLGDAPLVDAALAGASEPVHDGQGDACARMDGPGGAHLVLRSARGEVRAAIRLIDVQGVSDVDGLTVLLDGVAELVAEALDQLDDQERFEQAQRFAQVGSWEWWAATDEVFLSEQMYRNLGAAPSRMEHTLAGYLERVHPDDRDLVVERVGRALAEGGPWHIVHRAVADDGQVRWIEGNGQVAVDEAGTAVCVRGVGQDITDRRRLEQQLAERAACDQLTGLANRAVFQARLAGMVNDAADGAGIVAVALVDIDGFREINERCGWAAGDQLLQEVADRLRSGLPEAELVARLGGDEFALVLRADGRSDALDRLGEDVAALLEAPSLRLGGRVVSAGVGVAADIDGAQSPDELVRAAGIALEVARARTDARWQVFDPDKHADALQRLAMEADLRQAVEDGDIEVVYQPVLALGSGGIAGFEALARWDRPGHGPISPMVFIPMAERVGLIRQLGAHVLETACRQLAVWQDADPRLRACHVAVNLSVLQLEDPRLVEVVEGTVDRCDLEHGRLVLEVTETALAHDTPGALARLFELRRRGVKVAIDDFGTGYSSLSRLRELPFDILKIDRAFVRDINSRHAPSPILQALFSITGSLGLDVVAEGVETPVQLAGLAAHECDYVQGYLFSRPLPPAELESLLADQERWDIARIVAQVPAPRMTPRLQELLRQLGDAAHPSDEALDELLAVLTEMTGLDSVYLTRIDLRQGIQQILAAANTGPLRIDPGVQVPWAQTLCRRALADNRRVVPDAAAAYPDADVASDLGITTYVGVEVHGPKGGLRGTLCGVSGTRAEVPQEVVETLQWVARLLADPLQDLEVVPVAPEP